MPSVAGIVVELAVTQFILELCCMNWAEKTQKKKKKAKKLSGIRSLDLKQQRSCACQPGALTIELDTLWMGKSDKNTILNQFAAVTRSRPVLYAGSEDHLNQLITLAITDRLLLNFDTI